MTPFAKAQSLGARSLVRLTLIASLAIHSMGSAASAAEDGAQPAQLSEAEAWKKLPPAAEGQGQPLPSWARMLAAELPKTTATLLQLDQAQRTMSPVPPGLRAAMRWVSAHANHCAYAEAYAVFDARNAGVDQAKIDGLVKSGYPGWSKPEQAALEFARKMSVDSDAVTDAEFAAIVKHFGDRQAASMVLLFAYSNFQDRFLICLNAPLEPNGPLPPAAISFAPESLVTKGGKPSTADKQPLPKPAGTATDADWSALNYDSWQERLENQRRKPTRLRVPAWDEVAANAPASLFAKPSDIVWYRIVFGYAPELAVPFEYFMRTAGAETSSKWDRIFSQTLFWITTRAVKCPYCMGHCEMNWEVAGLNKSEIAERSQLLASGDWSSFKPAEQKALAFAKKLASTPGKITRDDVADLTRAWGADKALITMLHASRHNYMVRISNGFQLTLERENVFYDYYSVPAPAKGDGAKAQVDAAQSPFVPLLSDEECWKRLPSTVSGGGQPLPSWVRAVATNLPRTAAAMLVLDFAHRTKSPLDPVLRAKMRWVIAHANRCAYSEAYALADLKRAGADAAAISALTGAPDGWPAADREPLEFARLLTVAAPTIPDELFERLRQRFNDNQVAAMVLLAAYGNFQDRMVLGLNLPMEPTGPLAPLEVRFLSDAFPPAPSVPLPNHSAQLGKTGRTVVDEDADWSAVSYDELQSRLERQRDRKPRLPVPTWEEIKKKVPGAASAPRPTRIVWTLVCTGYVPELALPWGTATRMLRLEGMPDRVFEESLFWIQTRSIGCNYCMGHCEMLLEVAGLDKAGIAERTKLLAGSDWSRFPPAEQRAYAYARKLSKTPWLLTGDDYRTLKSDLGSDRAMATFWWVCRGLYMTRISDGFQLPLERENVFQNAPPVRPAN